MRDHQQIDERSLAMHRMIAAKVRDDQTLLEQAGGNARRWLIDCAPAVRPALEEWLSLLSGPRTELFQVMEGCDERARRLRQSSPFTGALTPAERNRLFRAFERPSEAHSA